MKKVLLVMAVLCMLVETAFAADFSNLIILHTNDTHGFDQRAEGIFGMATVAALKKDYEAKGKTVLLVDAGDAIQDNNLVNFSQGKSAIEFMNASGYDAMTLGNHEFDYGQDVTLKRVKEAKFPVVSANTIVDATGKFFVKPNVIITKDNVKIGIFGLTTPESKVTTNAKNVIGLSFLAGNNLYDCAQKQVDYLRGEGCDVIVALAHLGSSPASNGHRSNDIAANVKGIDIIIDGHDHEVKNLYVNNTLIAETGFYTHNIGKIEWNGKKWQSEMIPYNTSLPEDSEVKKLIDTTALKVKKELNKEIGVSKVLLDGTRAPGVRTQETNLGDFVADAYLWQAKEALVLTENVDAAIVNGGNLRYSLLPGKITRGSIHQILPYTNQLYVVKIKGSTVLELLEGATYISPSPLGAFPQVSGIKFSINSKVAYKKGKQYYNFKYYAPANLGSRVTISEIGGKPYDTDRYYYVVVNEFQRNGGDSYACLKALPWDCVQSVGYVEAIAVENYIKSVLKGKIDERYANAAGRIIYE